MKIEKHNHYQKQLEISHQKLKHVERFGDHEHVSRNKERYALLEEKTKELGYKVGPLGQGQAGRSLVPGSSLQEGATLPCPACAWLPLSEPWFPPLQRGGGHPTSQSFVGSSGMQPCGGICWELHL